MNCDQTEEGWFDLKGFMKAGPRWEEDTRSLVLVLLLEDRHHEVIEILWVDVDFLMCLNGTNELVLQTLLKHDNKKLTNVKFNV